MWSLEDINHDAIRKSEVCMVYSGIPPLMSALGAASHHDGFTAFDGGGPELGLGAHKLWGPVYQKGPDD